MTSTHTYAELAVPERVYHAIRSLMEEAGHAIGECGDPLDMHGVALVPHGETTGAELESEGRKLAEMIAEQIPPGMGFFVSMFAFGDAGDSTYISNAQRADVAAMMRELLVKLEGN